MLKAKRSRSSWVYSLIFHQITLLSAADIDSSKSNSVFSLKYSCAGWKHDTNHRFSPVAAENRTSNANTLLLFRCIACDIESQQV